MIKRTYFIIFTFLLTIVSSANPDKDLSLREAVNLALSKNPEILQVKNNLKQSKIGTKQSISAFLPTIDLMGQRILKEKVMRVEMPSFIPGEPPTDVELDFTKNYEMTLQLVQPVFTGGQIFFNLKRNLELKKIQTYLLESKKNEIKAKTLGTYYSILLYQKSANIAMDGLELVKALRDNINNMYDQGLVKRLDLLRAENRIIEMNMRYKEVLSKVVEAKNELKSILDYPLNTSITLNDTFQQKIFELDRDQLFSKMIKSNPLLNSLQNRVNVYKYGLKQAWGNLLPNLSLSVQYNFRGDNLDDIFHWDDYYSISLNISYPIFKGLSNHFNVALAKAQKEDSLIQEKLSKSKFGTMFTNCLERDAILLEKIAFAKKNQSNIKKELDIASVSYEEGFISYTDLEQIHNKYLSSQLTYFQAYFEYYMNIFQIETLTAEDIFLNQGDKNDKK